MSPWSRAIACLIAVASGCGHAQTKDSDPPAPRSASSAAAPASETRTPASAEANDGDAPAPKCSDDVDALTRLEGWSEAQILAAYGEPVGKKTFAMADCCHEFEIELYNTYPPGKGHDAVEIHEMTWQGGSNLLTVWTHRPKTDWVVLDTICYVEGTEF